MKKHFHPVHIALALPTILAIIFALASCSSEESDPGPAARVMTFTDADTDARYHIDGDEFGLFLLGSDTLTFTNIIPNPGIVGIFDFDDVEGTPGKFKNASLYEGGQQIQGIQAGRLEITAFSGDFIDFAYTVTFRDGKRLQGVYSGKIKPIK